MKEKIKTRFKNIKLGKEIIKNKFLEVGFESKFLWKSLDALLRFHPERAIGEIEYFIIRKHPVYKNDTLFYKEVGAEEDTISYNLCLRSVFGRVDMEKEKKKGILSELRNAIYDGTRTQFIFNTSRTTCEACERGGKLVCDHYPVPFSDIVKGYCGYKSVDLEQIEDHNDFKKYHDSIASYRLLCPECNSRFGNYKN